MNTHEAYDYDLRALGSLYILKRRREEKGKCTYRARRQFRRREVDDSKHLHLTLQRPVQIDRLMNLFLKDCLDNSFNAVILLLDAMEKFLTLSCPVLSYPIP